MVLGGLLVWRRLNSQIWSSNFLKKTFLCWSYLLELCQRVQGSICMQCYTHCMVEKVNKNKNKNRSSRAWVFLMSAALGQVIRTARLQTPQNAWEWSQAEGNGRVWHQMIHPNPCFWQMVRYIFGARPGRTAAQDTWCQRLGLQLRCCPIIYSFFFSSSTTMFFFSFFVVYN